MGYSVLSNLSALNDSALATYMMYFSPSFWARQMDFGLRFSNFDREQAANSIAEHYDDGNEFFRTWLGDDMVYTSASWSMADPSADLYQAQRNKVNRIIDLTGITKTDNTSRLMDIGSGWGYLVHAAHLRGIQASGLCNCESMVQKASEKFGKAHFSQMDYRDIPRTESYDAITSVEMIEAVHCDQYPDFVSACDRALKPGGRVVMQVINALSFNNSVARKRKPLMLGSFVTTHIFPGQQIPNLEFLHEAFLQSGKFKRIYSETATHDYAKTLKCWRDNLEANASKFPPRMVKKYRYYLAFCEAGFENELLHLTRVVFEKASGRDYAGDKA